MPYCIRLSSLFCKALFFHLDHITCRPNCDLVHNYFSNGLSLQSIQGPAFSFLNQVSLHTHPRGILYRYNLKRLGAASSVKRVSNRTRRTRTVTSFDPHQNVMNIILHTFGGSIFEIKRTTINLSVHVTCNYSCC